MKTTRTYILMGIAAILIVGCSGDDTTNVNLPESRYTAEITGRVFSYPDTKPVAAASYTVVGTDKSGVADSDGLYTISGLSLGVYDLLVSSPGYATSRVTVVIQLNNAGASRLNLHVARNIYLLERSAEMSATIYSGGDGKPAAGAIVDIASWKFPEEALGHVVEDDSLECTAHADTNGTVTMTKLPAVPATMTIRPYDADSDGVTDYGTKVEYIDLAPDSKIRKTVVLRFHTDVLELVQSNLPNNRYGTVQDASLLYFIFSTAMNTNLSTTYFRMVDLYGNDEVPCVMEWTSEIRLEVRPNVLLIESGTSYYIRIEVRSTDGADYISYWEVAIYADDPGDPGGDCQFVVTDLAATSTWGFDYDTRDFDLSWTAVSCADGYKIYAKDDRHNPDWVLIKEDPTDYEFGTIYSALTLPEQFDRYRIDAIQTPLAGIDVTFCVVPAEAENPSPGGYHGIVTVADTTAPLINDVKQLGSGANAASVPVVVVFDYDFSEYLSSTVSDPVVEIVEAGGDPSFALDPEDATWIWKDARSGGKVEFSVPAGANAGGDQIRIVFDRFADISENAVPGTYRSEWLTISEDARFDFESGPQGWYSSAPGLGWEWGKPMHGTYSTHSGEYCWTTDLDTYYGNNWNVSVFSGLLTVPLTSPTLQFWTWFDIHYTTDYCDLYIHTTASADSLYRYAGYGTSWTQQEFDLSSYAGQSIRIEFRFVSDVSGIDHGFFFDDVMLFSANPLVERFR